MSTISPVSGQSYGSSSQSSQVQQEKSVNSEGKLSAGSNSSSVTDVANENAQLTVQEIEQTVESLNNAMTLIERGINFEVDNDNDRTIIRIVDRDTDEVIKQIPSEDLLKLIDHMQEMKALLFEQTA